MAEVKVFYDREGKTLTVWFTDRSEEYVCEETGDEVVLMKDRSGRVIGFEKLNFVAGVGRLQALTLKARRSCRRVQGCHAAVRRQRGN
jgi:hypothetical protein